MNENEIEKFMARYEPRLVRFFHFLVLRGGVHILHGVYVGDDIQDLTRNAAIAEPIEASAAAIEIYIASFEESF